MSVTDVYMVKPQGNSLPVGLASLPDVRETWRAGNWSSVAVNTIPILTVPANTEYQIQWVYLKFTPTAQAGNRQIAVQVLDASNTIIGGIRAGVTQAASSGPRFYMFGGVPQDAAFRDTDYCGVTMPILLLTAGQKLKIWDKAAIDAPNDDYEVYVQIASRSIS